MLLSGLLSHTLCLGNTVSTAVGVHSVMITWQNDQKDQGLRHCLEVGCSWLKPRGLLALYSHFQSTSVAERASNLQTEIL